MFLFRTLPVESDVADPPMRIYVGGLTDHLSDITEMDLRNIFHFGEIDLIDLPKDHNTGKCRGYAFIQFRRASQAREAISAMNGFNYKGKPIKVFFIFYFLGRRSTSCNEKWK